MLARDVVMTGAGRHLPRRRDRCADPLSLQILLDDTIDGVPDDRGHRSPTPARDLSQMSDLVF